jgi:hypothetical protein
VFDRTAVVAGGYISFAGNSEIRGSTNPNALIFGCGLTTGGTVSDSAFHGVTGLCNGASSAINIDGTDTGSISNGTSNLSANTLTIGKSGAGTFVTAEIAEIIFWGATTTPTQRGSIFTNQNGSNGYNGAL